MGIKPNQEAAANCVITLFNNAIVSEEHNLLSNTGQGQAGPDATWAQPFVSLEH